MLSKLSKLSEEYNVAERLFNIQIVLIALADRSIDDEPSPVYVTRSLYDDDG